HLRNERIVEGRLWERNPLAEMPLRFSRHALDFLIWLTANGPGRGKAAWRAPGEQLTAADHLLIFIAYEVLHETDAATGLRSSPSVTGCALCRLAFPQDFLQAQPLTAADFAPWTAGLAGCILEVLQLSLARGWVQL